MTKTFQDKTLFGFSNFGYWNLFDIWDLIFGISIFVIPRTQQREIQYFQILMTDLDPGLSALSSRPKGFSRGDNFLRVRHC